MKATMAALFITSFDSPTAVFSMQRGVPDEVMVMMRSSEFRDPWLSQMDLATAPQGRVVRSNDICPDEILEQDLWYQRACLPYGFHYGGGVILENSATRLAAMSCNRPRHCGPLSDSEVAFWQELAPHVARAVRLIGMRTKLSGERDALMCYFDDFGQGMILTTPEAFVLAANASARSIIQEGKTLRTSGGKIVVADEESGKALAQALLRTGESSPLDSAQISLRSTGRQPLLATVLPLQRAARDSQVSANSPTAVIHLVNPSALVEFDPRPLRLLFGFTMAEARLACRLASGCSLAEAAEGLGVSLNTVRTHLQRALSKAGLSRQAELVAVVLKTCRSQRY